MPDAAKIRALLLTRYPRSMDAWRERIDVELPSPALDVPVVARVERDDSTVLDLPETATAVQRALRIKFLRHLGGREYIVHLNDYEDQNRLALEGHLKVSRGGYRLTAI
jgi:hypothetical protein